MSALAPTLVVLAPLRAAELDAVMRIEQASYPVPWTRGNFIDSLAAGYLAYALRSADGAQLYGYFLAMKGVDEMHLLNITVAPEHQGQGLARRMLDELGRLCREQGCAQLWLEVRVGNERARAVYRQYGFTETGLRKRYYPQPDGGREDAVLMSLEIGA